MTQKLLIINPGSTSTRIAVFQGMQQIYYDKVEHSVEELSCFSGIMEQLSMRKRSVLHFLEQNQVTASDLAAIVGRGGMLQQIESGAYVVTKTMLEELEERPYMEHASNLGAFIAWEIGQDYGLPAYIYDSPRSDVLTPVAKISGLVDLPRTSTSHVLNSRAVARKAAEDMGKTYDQVNLIVAHLGGGISMSVHEKGTIIDIISDDEGPFSPECSGRLPARELIRLCYSGKYTADEMQKRLRGNGGIKSYLHTVDLREVQDQAQEGNDLADLLFHALAYQIAKGIGELAPVVRGEVDAIVITGGMAHSKELMEEVIEKVSFIAPVVLLPGQYEMEALAEGTLRVLQGQEKAKLL